MPLSVLNNISSLTAENALSTTQMNLQKTLTQLSTGLKINSGSDDAAGLSINNGLQANIAALTQSQQNASNGIGLLQTADGALSQVSTLLNRAITLATEASTSGFNGSQATALDTEFQSILTEINQIGAATNFNGQNVFAGNTGKALDTTAGTALNPLTTASTLAVGSVTTVSQTTTAGVTTTSSFTATSGAHAISDLDTFLQGVASAGGLGLTSTEDFKAGTVTQGSLASAGGDTNNLEFTGDGTSTYTISTSDTTALQSVNAYSNGNNNNSVFISDSSTIDTAANTLITTSISALSAAVLGLTKTSGTNIGANDDLLSTTTAQAALTALNGAITAVSAQRGAIGASVNRLNAVVNVISNQVQNVTSASNNIQNADIGKTVASMTQYNILQSTGMAALQQSNQTQQAVLKLVQ
jgi:flagellin